MPQHPQTVAHLKKKLVSTARAIITYQVGLSVGCIRVDRTLSWLRQDIPLSYPVFDEYLRSVQELPISTERLEWNRDALRASDKKLEAANR